MNGIPVLQQSTVLMFKIIPIILLIGWFWMYPPDFFSSNSPFVVIMGELLLLFGGLALVVLGFGVYVYISRVGLSREDEVHE